MSAFNSACNKESAARAASIESLSSDFGSELPARLQEANAAASANIKKAFFIFSVLLLSEIYLNRNTTEVEMFSELVFQEPFIGLPDVLRQVTEEGKHGRGPVYLGNVFDLHIFPF